jgi:hypothetical protein
MAFQSGVTAEGSGASIALTYAVALVLVGSVGTFATMLALEVRNSVRFAHRTRLTRRSVPVTTLQPAGGWMDNPLRKSAGSDSSQRGATGTPAPSAGAAVGREGIPGHVQRASGGRSWEDGGRAVRSAMLAVAPRALAFRKSKAHGHVPPSGVGPGRVPAPVTTPAPAPPALPAPPPPPGSPCSAPSSGLNPAAVIPGLRPDVVSAAETTSAQDHTTPASSMSSEPVVVVVASGNAST